LAASKVFTAIWGVFAILFALFSSLVDNLIQAVNILGSLFYGVILGIFVLAFVFKYVKANAVFFAAIIGEIMVVSIWLLSEKGIIALSFLWLNLVGCIVVVLLGLLFQLFLNEQNTTKNESL
jgi:hypothetical protein